MATSERETGEYDLGGDFGEKFFAPQPRRLRFEFGAATHTGKVRSNNEDHFIVVKRHRTNEVVLSNLPACDFVLTDDAAYCMVVADGMGGANFGEFASALAIQRMSELSQQATSWVMKFADLNAQQIRQRVDAYVQEIQRTFKDYIRANPPLAGMGTTWTSAYLVPPHAIVVHIGDSRAYLLHRGELDQITHDDTVAQAYLDAGADPSLAKKVRHLLLNSFGGDADDVAARIHLLEITPGDKLLLCSDGLTDMVEDKQISDILEQFSSPQAACDKLISAALANGGKDNVTVILAAAAGDAV